MGFEKCNTCDQEAILREAGGTLRCGLCWRDQMGATFQGYGFQGETPPVPSLCSEDEEEEIAGAQFDLLGGFDDGPQMPQVSFDHLVW